MGKNLLIREKILVQDFQRYLQETHQRVQAMLKTQRSLGGHKPRPIIVDEVFSASSQLEGQNLHLHDSSSIHLPPMSALLSTHHFAFPFPSYLLRFSGLDLEVHQWVEVPQLREMNKGELMGLEKMCS
ncbi:hypothetical protein J1N35_030294 [Gossypium stocksii]|uniref:Uncharacterized protein n=1 Tax=Gossypium stocksii TaxID=47602 RepID=A0A9D3V090_9ROSI|nr:hypothetical protein J1N35_030294 [Gossypium stocksii]